MLAPSDTFCGPSGEQCIDCTSAGARCNSSTHRCEPTGTGGGSGDPCSPANCPGCCLNDICLPFSGQVASSCGWGGVTCKQCAAGESCDGGRCAVAMPSVTGQPCMGDMDCGTLGQGATCLKASAAGYTYPLGYCSLSCTAQSQCAADAVCARPLPNEPSPLCLSRCSAPHTQSTCRGDYYCFELTVGGGGACWLVEPFLPDAGPPFDKVGAECTSSSMCDPANPAGAGRGLCIPETLDGGPTAFTGGYCTGDCGLNPRVCSTDGGAVCVGIGNDQYICERSCTRPGAGQSSCRPGYVCYGYSLRTSDGGARPSSSGVCEPSCSVSGSLYGCAANSYCDAGYCVQ